MKEKESSSTLLFFPAITLQFIISIIRKTKGRTVSNNLKPSVYIFIICSKLIKEILIHNTMGMESYFLEILLLCIDKNNLCSDGKHSTMGKRQFFPLEFRLHKKSSSVHSQRFSETQWQEGEPKYFARLLPGPTLEPCKATLISLKENQGMQWQVGTKNKDSQETFISFCFMLEKLN